MVEHRILGQRWSPMPDSPDARSLTLRVATRRFLTLDSPDDETTRAFVKRAHAIMRSGRNVETTKVRSWVMDAQGHGHLKTLWRQSWISTKREEQLWTLSQRKLKRSLGRSIVREVRISQWQKEKPGSHPREERWLRELGRSDAWTRLKAVREAGHQTHSGGRDADISYVTQDNRHHFSKRPASIDAKATWLWFQLLVKEARRAGARIDRILVDRAVRRHLADTLPETIQTTTLWRKTLRTVQGHGAHHHVRIDGLTKRNTRESVGFLHGLESDVLIYGPPAPQ